MRTPLLIACLVFLPAPAFADECDSYAPTQAEVVQAMAAAGVTTKAPIIYTACDLHARKGRWYYYDALNPVAKKQGYPGSILLDIRWREHDGLRLAFRDMAGHSVSSPQAKALMPRVEAKLIELEFNVQGYARLTAPAVTKADFGARSPMARIDGGVITLNTQATPGCDDVLIAHELAHDALARILGIKARSQQSEAAATEVAWAIAASPYRPNCVTGNKLGGTLNETHEPGSLRETSPGMPPWQ